MKLGTAASAVSLVNGAWMIYAGWLWRGTFFVPLLTPVGAPEVAASVNVELLALGVILVLDSLVCLLDWTKALYASAVLSALGLLDVVVAGPSPGSAGFEVGAVLLSLFLGVLTMAMDVVAARRRTFVSEADHPLNLPVFG